jgi:prephenate dehydrogenase
VNSDTPHDSIVSDAEALTLPQAEQAQVDEFETIAIIGVGMIGGSIGLALRESGFRGQITGLDKKDILDEALAFGAIDRAVGDLAEAVPLADLVVMATPVVETLKLLPTVLKTAQSGRIVTDTGGTKAEVCALASHTKNARGVFIGGHPLTGSARSGLANARAELFASAYYVLTPQEKTADYQLESLKWWVRRLGALPLVLDPTQHDRLVANISHLPLLVALALTEGAGDLARTHPVLYRLVLGDFREMTRMSESTYDAWEGLLYTNKEEILKAIASLRKSLKSYETQLKQDDLTESFRRAHSFRSRMMRHSFGLWDARCELIVTAPDRPGTFARITGLLADHDITIRDLRVIFVRETHGGTVRLVVASPSEAELALKLLKEDGFDAHLRE